MNDALLNGLVNAVAQAGSILIKALEGSGVNSGEVLASITTELNRIGMQEVKDADAERDIFENADKNPTR